MKVTKNMRQAQTNWTEIEIKQQPDAWQQVATELVSHPVHNWLSSLLNTSNLRIILTGAGTSAYIGEALAPYLTQATGRLIESISTTDLVANPEQYLIKTIPTLLISYGRSGNSPESLAAATLAEQLLDECHQLIISCNADGQLAHFHKQAKSSCVYLLPEQTHDKSFAMTSSFTSMCVATLCLFAPAPEKLQALSQSVRHMLQPWQQQTAEIASKDITRVIFLGSGCLQGIAREASLKYLELTAGKIDCYYESALGFRHGPKSSVDENTYIYLLTENNKYTQQYDIDMFKELKADNQAACIYQLDVGSITGAASLDGPWLGLAYIVFCQLLAMQQSLLMGLTPDNPCPGGEVNRVVQGVNIYPYKAQ